MKENLAIKVENVTKEFVLPHQKVSTIKSSVVSLFRKYDNEEQIAVDDVSFEIKKGEFFGIVGRNGSGKSTLLKCIAGVYSPSRGSIKFNGKLVPFIELGVGFNPQLSGRDNVFLNGALLGFSHHQIERMYKDIVEFAELGDFMDQKLKNYSSGMQVRLAFSIAIRARGDILLLDEVLAVGDAAFQQKCNDYFASLKRGKQTIILVSHNMVAIEKYCEKALLMEQGKILKIGPANEIADMYEDMSLKAEAIKRRMSLSRKSKSQKNQPATVKLEVVQKNKNTQTIKAFNDFHLKLDIKPTVSTKKVYFGISIKSSEGHVVSALDTLDQIGTLNLVKSKQESLRIEMDNIFTNGTYYVTITMNQEDRTPNDQIFKLRNINSFTVYGVRSNPESLVHPRYKISRD